MINQPISGSVELWLLEKKLKELMKSCYSNEISKFRCDGVISTTPRKPNNFYTIKWDEHQIEIAIK